MNDPIITPEIAAVLTRLFMRMQTENKDQSISTTRDIIKPIVTDGGTSVYPGSLVYSPNDPQAVVYGDATAANPGVDKQPNFSDHVHNLDPTVGGDLAGELPNPTIPHITDTTDAHDAAAVSFDDTGTGLAADDVQEAIVQLDSDLDAHIGDTVDAHDASAISNVPAGTIAATTVQAAINELAGDIAAISALTVKEIDGTPTETPTTTIEFPNGTLTEPSTGVVRYTPAGGSGLTHWSEDGSGNLINDDGGGLLASSITDPIYIKNFFVSGGPADESEGSVFRVISDNWNFDVAPSDLLALEVNDWFGEVVSHNFFGVGARNIGGAAYLFAGSEWSEIPSTNFGQYVIQSVQNAGISEVEWSLRKNLTTVQALRLKLTESGSQLGIKFGTGSAVNFPITVNAAATDPATTMALVNQLRQLLIDIGFAA